MQCCSNKSCSSAFNPVGPFSSLKHSGIHFFSIKPRARYNPLDECSAVDVQEQTSFKRQDYLPRLKIWTSACKVDLWHLSNLKEQQEM